MYKLNESSSSSSSSSSWRRNDIVMMIQNNALIVDIDITLMICQATNAVEFYNQVTNEATNQATNADESELSYYYAMLLEEIYCGILN